MFFFSSENGKEICLRPLVQTADAFFFNADVFLINMLYSC